MCGQPCVPTAPCTASGLDSITGRWLTVALRMHPWKADRPAGKVGTETPSREEEEELKRATGTRWWCGDGGYSDQYQQYQLIWPCVFHFVKWQNDEQKERNMKPAHHLPLLPSVTSFCTIRWILFYLRFYMVHQRQTKTGTWPCFLLQCFRNVIMDPEALVLCMYN